MNISLAELSLLFLSLMFVNNYGMDVDSNELFCEGPKCSLSSHEGTSKYKNDKQTFQTKDLDLKEINLIKRTAVEVHIDVDLSIFKKLLKMFSFVPTLGNLVD